MGITSSSAEKRWIGSLNSAGTELPGFAPPQRVDQGALPSPPPEPAFQQRGGFSASKPALHRHGVVGAGVCRQVEAAPPSPPRLGSAAANRPTSPCGPGSRRCGAHRASSRGHQQVAAVEAPIRPREQAAWRRGHQSACPRGACGGLALGWFHPCNGRCPSEHRAARPRHLARSRPGAARPRLCRLHQSTAASPCSNLPSVPGISDINSLRASA